jgi:hypothetical protein
MILHCTYEELSALSAGGERVLAEAGSGVSVIVAPAEVIADVEALLPRLIGDLSITSMAQQQSIARAVSFIVAELKQRMDAMIVETHPADEYAVGAYFDYAHALSIQERVAHAGAEMQAIAHLVMGEGAPPEAIRNFVIPD